MADKEEKSEALVPVPAGEEESITLGEFVQNLTYMEETAEVLFANQDPSVCTFPEGYKPRQTLFTCLTCTPSPKMAGVCYGCSLNCHNGHEIIELYTKRNFRCDCGNSKFGENKCTLYEEKDAENKYNVYNHNYDGKFCTCDVFYPDDDKENELLQCEICEDWFHDDHMSFKDIVYEEGQTSDGSSKENASAICTSCTKKLPFLMHIKPGKEVLCHSKLTTEQLTGAEAPELTALCISNFRQKLCKCADCIRVYEKADCEFLMDSEDDIATFEKESRKKAEENRTTDDDDMRELVKEVGMDGAQLFYSGLNNFKRKFADFVNTTSEGGKTISEEDVKKFAADLMEDHRQKRPRFE